MSQGEAWTGPAGRPLGKSVVAAALGSHVALGCIGVLGVVLAWEMMVRTGILADAVPGAFEVIGAAIKMVSDPEVLPHLRSTLTAWLWSVVLVAVTAIPLGILIGTTPILHRGATPLIELLRPIPSVGLLPLAILLFGLSTDLKVALACYASFWPLLINSMYGVRDTERVLLDVARTMGWGRVRTLRKVVLRSALPYIVTGLRISVSVALVLVLTAELLAATDGIGHEIALYQTAGARDLVFAGVLIVGLIGSLAYGLLVWVERRAMPWAHQGKMGPS